MGFFKSAFLTVIVAIVITKLPGYFHTPPEVPGPKGFVKPGWEKVKQAFK